ncbi:MAG: heavy-metal-associated domain-containing protein [Muribaculaceae bacterium]
MKKILSLALAAVCCLGVNAKSVKQSLDTLVVTTNPQMHCSGCEAKIKKNIRFVKGVKKIETSVAQQKVTIVYNNSQTSYEDFVKAFGKIGYEIKQKK